VTKQHVQRTLIVDEMLRTERTFVRNLQMLLHVFVHPLRKAAARFDANQEYLGLGLFEFDPILE
jgi:hypothetical protein